MNDAYFNSGVLESAKNLDDEGVRKIITEIDNGEVQDNFNIRNKETSVLFPAESLSTGCKTAINIYLYPEEIFSMDYIFKLLISLYVHM